MRVSDCKDPAISAYRVFVRLREVGVPWTGLSSLGVFLGPAGAACVPGRRGTGTSTFGPRMVDQDSRPTLLPDTAPPTRQWECGLRRRDLSLFGIFEVGGHSPSVTNSPEPFSLGEE